MAQLITFKPVLVAVLPERKLVHMARIGKPDPVACLHSVWSMLGLSWVRWELLVQARCKAVGIATWAGKSSNRRRTLLVAWHKVPEVLELVWQDLRDNAKDRVANEAARLVSAWPDRRKLEATRQPLTRDEQAGHALGAVDAENGSIGPKSESVVLQPKPGRVKILRSVHKPEVLRLLNEGLNTVQIAKTMGISRPAVSQIINDTYAYRHD